MSLKVENEHCRGILPYSSWRGLEFSYQKLRSQAILMGIPLPIPSKTYNYTHYIWLTTFVDAAFLLYPQNSYAGKEDTFVKKKL